MKRRAATWKELTLYTAPLTSFSLTSRSLVSLTENVSIRPCIISQQTSCKALIHPRASGHHGMASKAIAAAQGRSYIADKQGTWSIFLHRSNSTEHGIAAGILLCSFMLGGWS